MLIWLNGSFGVGKTQTAFELTSRLPGSRVIDPERIGYALRALTPQALRPDDFQQLRHWRTAVRDHLAWLAPQLTGVGVVPMTLLQPSWHSEIVDGLRERGVQLLHVTLIARPETIAQRLRSRRDASNTWALGKLEQYRDAMHDARFAQHIDTEACDISTVAETIADLAQLRLQPRASPLSTRLRRIRTWLRHSRFDH